MRTALTITLNTPFLHSFNEKSINHEFPLDKSLIHLNHAGVSPWPLRTTKMVAQFSEENQSLGSLYYPRWTEVESQLRGQLQRLIGAPNVDDIALLKNTSEALSVVAYGLPWKRGDSIVGIQQEFPSNRVVWESLETRYGVNYRCVDTATTDDPEAALIDAVDSSTRLLAISAVQYASGLRLDLERLGDYCKRNDILFCIDAIQWLGALPFDVEACQADFVAADGHKWLLGPEAVALFYCRAEQRERLSLNQFGWHMLENHHDFDAPDWAPANSARRFECGSPNNLGIHAQSASLSLLEEVGMKTVAANIEQRVTHIIEHIHRRRYTLLSPSEASRRAGIVTFRMAGVDHEQLFLRLLEHKLLSACRMEGLRFSPHFYTPLERIDAGFELIDELQGTCMK